MDLIEFNRPTIKRGDMGAVLQTMVDEKIGPGERREELAGRLCELAGLADGVLLRSLPLAMEAALSLAGLGPGDTLAISPLAGALWAEAARKAGVEPVLRDIDPATGCLAPPEAGACLLAEPYGALPAPGTGSVAIEDVSASLGGSWGDLKAGSLGDVVVCALEEDSLVSAAGGAFVGVRSGKLPDGMRGPLARYSELPDLNSALALVQLRNLDERLARRKELHQLYKRSLQATAHRSFGPADPAFEPSGGDFCVLLDSKPDEVAKFAAKYGVPVRRAFGEAAGRDRSGDFDAIPNAIPHLLRGVLFPIYPFLSKSEVQAISRVIGHLP